MTMAAPKIETGPRARAPGSWGRTEALTDEELEVVRAMLREHGEHGTAHRLRVSPGTASRIAAGLPARPMTIIYVRAQLATLAAAVAAGSAETK